MHVISTSGKYVVCCGRHLVFVFTTRHSSPNLFVMDTTKTIVKQGVPAVARGSLSCVDISKNSKFICAADTEKHAYVFENVGDNHWDFMFAFETEKRCEKVVFNPRSTAILLLDKCGDVWWTGMTVTEMQKPVRILCHETPILDAVFSANNRDVVFADQDIKLVTAAFPPSGIAIENFVFGHTAPVVTVAFVEQDHLILSVASSGELKLWSRKDYRCLGTYNILHASEVPSKTDANLNERKVVYVKLTEVRDSIWLAAKIFGFREIPVLRLKHTQKDCRKVSQVKMESEFCDFTWNQESLFVFSVEGTDVLKKFHVTTHGLMADINFRVPNTVEYSHDLKAFAKFYMQVHIAWVSGRSTPSRLGNETPRTTQISSRMTNTMRRSVSFAHPLKVELDDNTGDEDTELLGKRSRSLRASNRSFQ